MQLSSVEEAGGRQAATQRGRPPQARNDDDPPHTAEGPPQARQAAAYGRSKTKIGCLENEIHIGAKLNAFSIGHREQAVVVQNAVECFNPFGINVTFANDPICACRQAP